ncbi:hypothetical protein SHKM778_48540 [Streptomyces sp. KM77-8]|uniref:XRE family transcriptional regulator n=1 Tax=Streptomyces haneummycinicus TaxID=3074435 RepID=A0AAT9HMK7_9ACTN
MNDAGEREAVTGDTVAPGGGPSHASRGELDAALATLRELENLLPQTAREAFGALLDPDSVSHSTGIEPDRVAALLEGAEPDGDTSRDASQARIVARLRFLRATRLKERAARRRGPRMHFFAEIARGAHISKQTVHYVFENAQMTSPENVAAMERYFGVRPGFCSCTEAEALAGYLDPIVRQLTILYQAAEAAADGVTRVAARSDRDVSHVSRDSGAMTEILDAVLAARRGQDR